MCLCKGKLLELLPDLVHEKGRKYHLEFLVECCTFKTNILKYIHKVEEMLTICNLDLGYLMDN